MEDEAVMLMSHEQSTKATDPGDRAIDLPTAVAAELAASAVGTDQVPPLGPQLAPQRVVAVGLIGDQGRRLLPPWDFFESFFGRYDLCRRSTFGPACHSVPPSPSVTPCAWRPCIAWFLRLRPPFLAGAKLSVHKHIVPIEQAPRIERIEEDMQILTSTSSPSHSTERLQQVMGDGYCLGRFRPRVPVRSPTKCFQAGSIVGRRPTSLGRSLALPEKRLDLLPLFVGNKDFVSSGYRNISFLWP